MGWVYGGPYAERIGGYAHEGYAARILPDGIETGSWTSETSEFTGYRARCECGWRGSYTYPPTDRGEGLAQEEWDHDHIRPMVREIASKHTVPATLLVELTRELRRRCEGKPSEYVHGVYSAAYELELLLTDSEQGEDPWWFGGGR